MLLYCILLNCIVNIVSVSDSLKSSQRSRSTDETDEEVPCATSDAEADLEYDSNDSFHQILANKNKPAKSAADKSSLEPVSEIDLAPNFLVMICIERAMHLPHIRDKSRY